MLLETWSTAYNYEKVSKATTPKPPEELSLDLRNLALTALDCDHRGIQAIVHNRLRLASDSWAFWEYLADRWISSSNPPIPGNWIRFQRIFGEAPPAIRSFFFRTFSRGWTTAARMQQCCAPCVFGCSGARDHIEHYVEECILWNHVQSVVPKFRALLGHTIFGAQFETDFEIAMQILGVEFAAQFYMLKLHFPWCANAALAHSTWLSKPVFFAVFK